jgi:radical SAM protein with 4Fe4S-binding SPASM domain
VVRRIEEIKKKFPGLLATSPLCVITADNAKDVKSLLDFYYELGFRDVGMLYLKHLGNAVRNDVTFDVREFLKYYIEALDYIYEKNKTLPQPYSERLVQIALTKIFSATDIPFVDWRNPVGYVTNSIVYDYDGEILPVDEARSLRNVFTLGNVMNTSYDQLIRKKETFKTINLSLRDRDAECRECAYNPYCGVSPVLHYAKTGEMNPRPYESDECFLVLTILDWVFKKLMEDPIPLVRMIPTLTRHLVSTVAGEKQEAAEREVVAV